MFGDGVYWKALIEAAADYDKRIKPTLTCQVVIPQEHVAIPSIKIKADVWSSVPEDSHIIPVWIPALERPWRA